MTTATVRSTLNPAIRIALSSLAILCCSAPQNHERPDIVLITLDTTRPDRLGSYGNTAIETPNLDRLAGEGVRFENAFTPVPSTLPSHSSIMTGLHPARHGVHDNGIYRLDSSLTTLAEALRGAGYATGAFVAAYVLDHRFGLDQGFEHYDDEMELPLQERRVDETDEEADKPDQARLWLQRQAAPYQRRADSVTARAIGWLRTQTDKPIFLWVHYFDPHMSYDAPEPWTTHYDPDYDGAMDGRMATFLHAAVSRDGLNPQSMSRRDLDHMIARYDGEISFMDSSIGVLFDELEALDRWDESLIVVVGDHGEGFGEHGQYWEHNGQIFDEVMRVPLIVRRPREESAGSVDSRLVSTLDVAPTVATEVGIPVWQETQGSSLFASGEADQGSRRLLFEALRERQITDMPYSWIGLRGEDHKLISNLDHETKITKSGFYDLETDPDELRSVHMENADYLKVWEQQALNLYSRLGSESPSNSSDEVDSTTREALEALGYVD